MKRIFSKSRTIGAVIIFTAILFSLSILQAQDLKTIKLPAVNKSRGSSLMDALSKKASAQSLSEKDLSMQDLSDLMWAAAGINRTDNKKRTFSSAMNTQDTDIYVFMKDGVYLYDFENHALNPVISGDHRADISGSMSSGGGGASPGAPAGGAPASGGQAGGMPGGAPAGGQPAAPGGAAGSPSAGKSAPAKLSGFPVDLLIVGDASKYRAGNDEQKKEWSAYSAGMVSQNIMLFCAANDMGTKPRASFDKAKMKTLLKLKDTQNVIMELPVGYQK